MTVQTKRTFFPTVTFIVLAVFTFSNCSSSDPEVLPSNLQLSFSIATDGSGDVIVTATADNAISYEIDFGVTSRPILKTNAGIGIHTYLETGDYEVSVKAIGSKSSLSITETETITVDVFFAIPATGYSTPTSYDGMVAVWADEFDGTSINLDNWKHETGRGSNGWGNNELQYYQQGNTEVTDGKLIITAKKQSVGDANYTSSRLITKDKQSFKYGRIDIRAVLPNGQGIWPALWMLGSNFSTVGWPKCGEIDIMEMVGGSPTSTGKNNTVHGTLHWHDEVQSQNVCTCGQGDYPLPSGIFSDEFHVFSIVWNETTITWYVDDVEFHVINITPSHMEEFHEEFFFIMNVAVGGNWPGSPDASTVFPQRMAVDYIRVFQPQ